MISRRTILVNAAIAAVALTNEALAKNAKPSAAERFDTDHDGTVDLAEAKKAATETFNKLNADNDGTLDLKELGGRVSHKEFAAADGDHDKTLDKDEYLALVEQRFKSADGDGDGSVSAADSALRQVTPCCAFSIRAPSAKRTCPARDRGRAPIFEKGVAEKEMPISHP